MADIFAFTLGGIRLPRFNAGDREVEINLALALEDRENLDDLKQLVVSNAQGRPIQLGEIADFQVVPRARSIERENRKIRSMVRASFDGEKFGPTKEKITEIMDGLGLPAGITWSWNDRIQQQDEEGQQMALNFLLALALVYILMASLFESVVQPFAILFAIPFSLVGATWFLVATGTPFNLMANMGVLILMGIVVNNGIVLLDRVNYYRKEGLGREEAVLRAGQDRLRPIVMTASTTILGLLPLALGTSGVGGWAYYYPLARTVMGGLLSSTFLTLVVLPYINYGVESAAEWAKRLWSASAPQPAATAPAATD
jgi:HAE1 family hydrophobic/amphiphilic exporter-1